VMTIVAKVIVMIYQKVCPNYVWLVVRPMQGERERQDYLAALQMSLQGGEEDNDPRDGDFMPDEDDLGKGKGKGKGRGKGKRAAS